MKAPIWWKRPIIRPSNDFERAAVTHVQRVLRLNETGEMDEATISYLRGVQRLFKLRVTGILDEPTAVKIEEMREYYSC